MICSSKISIQLCVDHMPECSIHAHENRIHGDDVSYLAGAVQPIDGSAVGADPCLSA